MAKRESEQLKKGDARFQLIGKSKVNDFTFKIDEQSKHSDWIYNVLNLGVDCGASGTIYTEMMGGYGGERDNVVYVHGKKENNDGKMVDDYQNRYTIDWEDRLNEDLFEEIGNNCFISVGIEKDANDKYFIKKFLSEYDAIIYIKEHLEDDTVINVKGKLEYSEYNDTIQTRKKIESVFLSKVEDVEKFKATFSQTILVDKDSVGDVDKEKMVFPIDAYVVDYVGSPRINNKKVEIKKSVVFPKSFELAINKENPEKTAKVVKKLFKPSKDDVWEITVEGIITKGGATQTASVDDLPDDIKDLIEWGVLSETEALEKCVGNGSSVESYIVVNPKINKVGEGDERTVVLAIDKEKYKVADYVFLAILVAELTEKDEDFDEPEEDEDEDTLNDDDDLDMDDLLAGLDD